MQGENPNQYSLDSLQKTALTLMTALVITTFIASNIQALLWQSSAWLVSTVLPATVVDLTNDERTDLNQAPLVRNSTLDEAARMKAKHMAENEYFSHYSPDGVSPWYWFDESGYVYAHAGENLAIHFTDSSEVVEAWMKSPTHRQNIVNGLYTEIGVGTAKGKYEGYDTVYVVQLFGAPGVTVPASVETPSASIALAPVPEPVVPAEIISEPEPVAGPEVLPAQTDLESVPEASADLPSLTEATDEGEPVQTPVVERDTEIVIEPNRELLPASETLYSAEVVVVESPIIATSSGLAVANFTESTESHAGATVASIATKPNTLLQYIYITLALVVLVLLSTSIVVEARKLRYIQVAYSLALIVGMGGLWFVNSVLTSGAVII